MIIIFNEKRKFEIQIDDSIPQVIFTPRDYEDVPFVKIELKNLNFHQHALKCEDCKAFVDSFGTDTLDWFINYSGKIERLDLTNFGQDHVQSHSSFNIDSYFYGSILKLNLSTLPKEKESILELLEIEIARENYERCCILRDLLSE
jgi:hypothetical protein